MRSSNYRARWVFCTLAAVLIAGCGGKDAPQSGERTPEPKIVQPGEPGQPSREISPEEAEKATSVKPTQADVEFMQGMIHHHGQAILMTGWVPDRTDDRQIRLLAKRMELAQQSEIELMENWLKTQGAAPASEHDELMPGMLTQEQLDRLKGAEGREFERLFLRYMTRHHKGALTMVYDLRESGGGLQSEIDRFAREVESDQQIEIGRMQQLLAEIA